MKDKTIKTIKGISIAVIILMTAVTVMDLYFWTERWQNVKWIDGHTGWQTSVIICYIISTLMLTAAVIYFIINIMKGLKKCIIFNRLNTSVIYASAIIFFVYSFIHADDCERRLQWNIRIVDQLKHAHRNYGCQPAHPQDRKGQCCTLLHPGSPLQSFGLSTGRYT